jgi:hypothetical protein
MIYRIMLLAGIKAQTPLMVARFRYVAQGDSVEAS